MREKPLFSQCEELGSKKDCGFMPVIVQNASLPGGHASIRIQQHHNMYGTITNEMDREVCTCEKNEAHRNPRVHVTLYAVFHTWCV